MIVVFFALAKMGFSHLPFKSIQGGQIASAPVEILSVILGSPTKWIEERMMIQFLL